MTEAPSTRELISRIEKLGAASATGCLRVSLSGRVLELSLREGKLVRVEEEGHTAGAQLVQIAVNRGLVPPERVAEILDVPGGEEPGLLMLEVGLVDGHTLNDLRSLQVEQALGQLALDEILGVEFEGSERISPQYGLCPIPLHDLAGDILRRVEEWPVLVRRLEARDARLERLPAQSKRQLELSERERGLVRMVHEGADTVGGLVEQSRYGEFITLRTLHILLDKGVLGLVARPDGGSSDEAALQLRASREGRAHQLSTVLVVALVVLFGAVALWRWSAALEGPQSVELASSALQQKIALRQRSRIRAGLRAHQLMDDRLPATLDELAKSGALARSELYFPFFERPYYYQQEGEGVCVVLPPTH